ncbi:MAG: 2-dehydropantoate 2-reductase [Chromatiales bacterium]|nr:2-dehydropantoate 2-reductase [Chromatiales bacterium]
MRIAVMGAGGVGGYLGARLAAAGNDVHLIARGAHLAALRASGLRLRGVEPLDLPDIVATDDPATVGPVDLVLFCVKLYDTDAATAAVAPLVGADTMVLTLQNGIESVARIGAALGTQAVLGGAAYFPANITAPGEVTYLGKIARMPHVAFGEPGGGPSTRTRRLARICEDAGIEARVCDDTDLVLWEKFLLIAGTSATTTIARCTIGAVRDDPDLRWLLAAAIGEAARVGRAAGIALADDAEQRILDVLETNPADGKSSQLVDLENGKRLELDGLSGAVVRMGRALAEPTPVHSTVYAALKRYRDGPPR